MTFTRSAYRLFLLLLSCVVLLPGCNGSSTNEGGTAEDPLNGAWVDGVQDGPIKIYITELRFNNGSFEWTFDGDLEQRGVYDTASGILTVTIQNNYGSPLRLLSDYSSPYTIVADTLTWAGSRFTRK